MSDKSITQLPVLPTPIQATDTFVVVRSNVNYQAPNSLIASYSKIELEISSTEFLASFTTPIEVVPDQGASTYISVKSSTLTNLSDGTVAYDTGNRSSFLSNSDLSNSFGEFSSACTQSTTEFIIDMETASGDQLQPNQSVVFSTAIQNPILGDHSFKLVVYYSVETI